MKKLSRRYFIAGGLAALCAGGFYSWNLYQRFGSIPEKEPISAHWQNGEFHNLPEKLVFEIPDNEPYHSGSWLKFFLSRDGNRYPPAPIPSKMTDLKSLEDGDFVWLGHSSYLLKLNGKIICIDPVLDSRASPVPFTIPAWPGSSPYKADDFPKIDYLCISHDHWDHLDYKAVTSLKYDKILCGKGVGAHFASWGLKPVEELDWGDEWRDGDLRFIFTPSHHFSGRGLNRNKSLWGGFIFDAGSGGKIYFSGDGGYGSHFTDIGKKYGPFEIMFPDSGQYNRAWATVHMFPEQAVQAAIDAKSSLACPAHIGKFTLSWHPWDEPQKRFSKKAFEKGLNFGLPIIGEKWGIVGHKRY